MKRKITPLELLEMVKAGTAPEEVTYSGETYRLNGDKEYVCRNERLFMILPRRVETFTEKKIIEFNEVLLDESEKTFLNLLMVRMEMVHKISRDRIHVRDTDKTFDRVCIQYHDPQFGQYRQYLPSVAPDTWFKKLELGKEYTVEELYGKD